MRRSWIALAAWVPIVSCSDSNTETRVFLRLDAQQEVKLQADHTHLVITGIAGGVEKVTLDDGMAPGIATFPYIVELTPANDDATRTYRVEFTALVKGAAIASASVTSGYVAHQTRYLTLTLEDACIGVAPCGTDMTCEAGACVDAHATPASAPVAPEPTSSVDAGAANDAAVRPSDAGTQPVQSNDAQVSPPPLGSDAQVTPPPVVSDAQVPPSGGDAGGTRGGGGGDDTPCAGPNTGTWNGTLIPDMIVLKDTCEFEYITPSCMSTGTYTPITSSSGNVTLNIMSATSGVYVDNLGNEYSCLPAAIYQCNYQIDGTMFSYGCDGQEPVTYVR